MSKSNCAVLTYRPNAKKHDQVNHRGLDICDWTKRFKPYKHVYTLKQFQVLGPLETCFVAVYGIHAFLERLLSARLALPSRLRRDVIFIGLTSERFAKAMRKFTHRRHIWLLLVWHRNNATRHTCW